MKTFHNRNHHERHERTQTNKEPRPSLRNRNRCFIYNPFSVKISWRKNQAIFFCETKYLNSFPSLSPTDLLSQSSMCDSNDLTSVDGILPTLLKMARDHIVFNGTQINTHLMALSIC